MSGEISLGTAQEQIEQIENVLDEYESSNGIPSIKPPGEANEFDDYFSMNRDVIEKLSAEDCAQIAYRLGQYSYHLQRMFNREKARLAATQKLLDHIVAKHIHNYENRILKHEVKVNLIAQQDSYAMSLTKIINYAEQRVLDLTFLSNTVKNLSDIMIENQRIKRNRSIS